MKIFISLPMDAQNFENAKKRAAEVANLIRQLGHTPVSPFDVCDNFTSISFYLSRSIAAILNCHAILLCTGWSGSKRCRLEWNCAQIYNRRVIHHISEIKPIRR